MKILLVILAECLQDDHYLKEKESEQETGQKQNVYYRTAKNSCQKYVFGRMYGNYNNPFVFSCHYLNHSKQCIFKVIGVKVDSYSNF